MWLCNSTDVVGRAKALVKRRLEEDQTEVERKRELRRQLERKNRELECEFRRRRAMDKLRSE